MAHDYREWAEAFLAAGAAGDSAASRMYDIAAWLASGGECDDASKKALDDYIQWIIDNGRD